ncbi:3-oxoacyl-[acyl-carrier protein] reductase [Variovorax sp. PDC80]|jgi:3-oxoacyl-[acyl-carrier protein] reductase|uniref:SDR family oxidoreductase n=1 Tax=Variovorax sp. PDC80 TaxID=1882827 RepID=UPI0008F24BD7|nr:SDR family oxidoreductase [Variovorax sp. PDC80]SFO90223.1 3-oxoacyl-[acyl-carrier protein] reductase [Variovorax sp. PDC80]
MSESVVIVTGASSGIGKATALRLARNFSCVVLAARSGEQLEQVAAQVRALGAQALVVEGDLGDPQAAETVVARTLSQFGRIDALVNVAGAVPGLDLFEMTDAQWDSGLALKFHGARRLTLRAWEALKSSKGAVVFISGTAAEAPKAASAAVGTINAAIEALAKAFADRGIADGVQVNSVSPGAVMTGRRMGMIEKLASARHLDLDAAKAAVLASSGIARFGEPEEIADLIAFAVSPAARWMTGTVLRMDGGEIKSI